MQRSRCRSGSRSGFRAGVGVCSRDVELLLLAIWVIVITLGFRAISGPSSSAGNSKDMVAPPAKLVTKLKLLQVSNDGCSLKMCLSLMFISRKDCSLQELIMLSELPRKHHALALEAEDTTLQPDCKERLIRMGFFKFTLHR